MAVRRQTKIIATLGPSLDGIEKCRQAVEAGVDVFRLNFSHGKKENYTQHIHHLRHIAHQLQNPICILGDLQGPKIRIARFKQSPVQLQSGNPFCINVSLPDGDGDQKEVGCDYPAIVNDLTVGDKLLLDDGRIELQVQSIEANTKIHCLVIRGGELSDHKGINKFGGGLSAPALTEKDKQDLRIACEIGVDYLAISFPRSAQDMILARQLLDERNATHIGLIAKIERTEAVKNIDEILQVSDGVMVARGDLGVEIGDAEIPAVQKHIIQRARAFNKISITATQMMESMIHQSMPTRAEVSDVANAVLDGTDAVMLSAETATGHYPIETISAMSRICLTAEKNTLTLQNEQQLAIQVQKPDQAIALASMYTATHLPIAAIVALTESGSTPIWMSRVRTNIPIYAITRHHTTAQRLKLCRGVHPVYMDITKIYRDDLIHRILENLKQKMLIKTADLIILTKGEVVGVHGSTDTMKICQV